MTEVPNENTWRIEEHPVYGEMMWDIIWEANGEDERIHILCDKKDLLELKKLINEIL